MALLPNITYSPGESMQSAFDKMNGAIDKINSVLAGGTSGQIISKINATDFNFQFIAFDLPLKSDKDQGAWTAITLLNGAFVLGTTPSYRKDQFGYIQFKGSYAIPATETGSHMNMPLGFRPMQNNSFWIGRASSAEDSLSCALLINNLTGSSTTICPASVNTGNIIYNLDGLHYFVGI